MKFFFKIAVLFGIYLLVVTQAFANGSASHAPGEEHNDVAAVDPLILIVPVVVIVVGFLLWKFVLHNPKPPSSSPVQPVPNPQSQEKTVSQSGVGDNSQKSE